MPGEDAAGMSEAEQHEWTGTADRGIQRDDYQLTDRQPAEARLAMAVAVRGMSDITFRQRSGW